MAIRLSLVKKRTTAKKQKNILVNVMMNKTNYNRTALKRSVKITLGLIKLI